MYLKFNKIRWKNFLRTGNEFIEIDFTLANKTLVLGKNGWGKSTVLDGLTYGLFNKPFRKVNLPQLVNETTNKNCVVEVEFSIGKNEYKVIRGQKPKVFEIYVNGKMVDQTADTDDYQEYLENSILKTNYKSFCQIVILGSATYIPFMSMKVPERREIIEDLLDLKIFTTMNVLLKEKVSANNQAIKDMDNTIQSLKDKISLTEKHLAAMQSNNDELIADKKKELKQAEKDVDKFKSLIEQLKEAKDALSTDMVDVSKYTKKISQYEEIKADLERERSTLNKEIKFLNDNDDCPTCDQHITEEFKTGTLEEKNNRLKEIGEGLAAIETKLTPLKTKKREAEQDNSVTTANINTANSKISNVQGQLTGTERLVRSLTIEIDKLEEKTALKDDDGGLAQFKLDLANSALQYEQLLENKEIFDASALILKDKGIKARVIAQYIPKFNEYINKYLTAMDFHVKFELDENFDEIIYSKNKNNFSFNSFSEGLKLRINLAVLLSWRDVAKKKNSINTNLLIMDEILDSSLDVDGTDDFFKILDTIAVDNNTFIISPKGEEMMDKFDRVLKFSNNRNFSRLENV